MGNDNNGHYHKRRHSSAESTISIDKEEIRKAFRALASRFTTNEGVFTTSKKERTYYLATIPVFPEKTQTVKRTPSSKSMIIQLQEGDIFLGQIYIAGQITLDVNPLCTLNRIHLFDPPKLVNVSYDKSIRKFKRDEFVKVKVESIHQKNGTIDYSLIYEQAEGIPIYYHKALQPIDPKEERPHKDKEERLKKNHDERCRSIRNNNLAEKLNLSIISSRHSFIPELCDKSNLKIENETRAIRDKQNNELAMKTVRKGVKLTKEGKHGDAIQCFTQALNIYDKCVEAYVGRGAACANEGNYEGALDDLTKALDLDPSHPNALNYKYSVLTAIGEKLEKQGEFDHAHWKYQEAIGLSRKFPSDFKCKARALLERMNQKILKPVEVVTIPESDDRDAPKQRKDMSTEQRRRLAELEKFKESLKKSKK